MALDSSRLRWLLAGLLTFVNSFCLAAFHRVSEEDQAIRLLIKSKKGAFGVNVVAITQQRSGWGNGSDLRIKVLRSRSGRQHITVIAPLNHAGVESTDDGVRQLTYWPDIPELQDQDSPSRENRDLGKLFALAKQNYGFRLADAPSIAGRPAVCITATPRCNALDCRRYFLDKVTAYSLRLETISPRGKLTIIYDTKDVSYPDSIPDEAFEMHPLPGVHRTTYARPKSLTPLKAKDIVGFLPVVPKNMLMGFHFQDLQYSPNWKMIAVRLSDGLLRASVYEWLPDGRSKAPMPDSTLGSLHGIQFLLVSDSLSRGARSDLLNAIFSDAGKD